MQMISASSWAAERVMKVTSVDQTDEEDKPATKISTNVIAARIPLIMTAQRADAPGGRALNTPARATNSVDGKAPPSAHGTMRGRALCRRARGGLRARVSPCAWLVSVRRAR